MEVFGDTIHTYDMRQSRHDKVTVPIFYHPRQIKLHLSAADVDAALDELAAGADSDELERKKSRWAALAHAAGSADRVNTWPATSSSTSASAPSRSRVRR